MDYLAANNQLAAWEGWGIKETVMCPEPADGSSLCIYNVEHSLTSVAHEPSTMAAGNTAELSDSITKPQPQVSMVTTLLEYCFRTITSTPSLRVVCSH